MNHSATSIRVLMAGNICMIYLLTISNGLLYLLRSGLGTSPKPSSSINVSATDMMQRKHEFTLFSERFNPQRTIYPACISTFSISRLKSHSAGQFSRTILTVDHSTRLRNRNTCSKEQQLRVEKEEEENECHSYTMMHQRKESVIYSYAKTFSERKFLPPRNAFSNI